MRPHWMESTLFVGREDELAKFKEIITPGSEVQILNIHSNGDGGIGKTQLLLRMQTHCNFVPEDIFFTKKLIDFYHTETRSRIGVMRQIAEDLGIEHFTTFEKLVRTYHKTADVSERWEISFKLEEVFKDDYVTFSKTMENKVIVLFFDTYEVIQGTEFSRWIETELFPYLVQIQNQNTRIVVSGRYPLQEIDYSQLKVEDIKLKHLTFEEAIEFWKRCFNVQTDRELAEKIGADSEECTKNIYTLADGRPILLALFADWVNYKRNPLIAIDLLKKIEKETKKSVSSSLTKEHKQLFEQALIQRVALLEEPEDRVVTLMAIAYHRMTPEMFLFITKELPLPMRLDKEICEEILLKRLKPLSFIKYKEENIVLLHDEMRRLVVQHWWNHNDRGRTLRREIAKDILRYYDEKLLVEENIAEKDREIYSSERLTYVFLAESKDGLESFCSEFDIALEDGKYDYCNLILREAEGYHHENPQDIPFPDYLEINLRRVRYITEVKRHYEESLKIVNTVLEEHAGNPDWEHSALRGHFLMERGIAEFSLEKFKESVDSFQKAHDVFFYKATDDVWLHWTHNWIGYAYYRQGRFVKAETYLTQSRDGFYRILVEKSHSITERERRHLLQGIQTALGNLTAVYNYMGQFDKAIQNAEIALEIVRLLPRNTLEMARARATVGRAFVYAGRTIDAYHHFVEAGELLQEVRSRAITGRIKKDLGILQYRIAEIAHILEYHRAEDLEKIIERRYISDEAIEEARTLIEDAIEELSEEPVFKKELADAYYALGELYMVTLSEDHWQQSEQAFLESLKWGKESKFIYVVADTLESLVTLYYFWNAASRVPPEVKAENREKMERYQKELERAKEFDETRYPNLFGKYHITLGDIKFDEALEVFRSQQQGNLKAAMTALKEAFHHYVAAANLMETFNDELYYLTLQVLYNRLNIFIDEQLQKHDTSTVIDQLNELKPLWEKASRTSALETAFRFQKLYKYVLLRIQQKNIQEGIEDLQDHLWQVLNKKGNFGWVVLLSDCLIRVYRALISMSPEKDVYREKLILQLKETFGYYRVLRDDYHARQCIQAARDELKKLSDPSLREGLRGCLDSGEGTLKYRTGEYNQMLLFYLRGELDIARVKFDRQFPGVRKKAFELLQTSEKTLHAAISTLEQRLTEVNTEEEKARLQERMRVYQRQLAETKFRLGELMILHERFTDGEYQKSLDYLQEAIDGAQKVGDHYRYDNAMVSYVNILYFSGNYDHPEYREHRIDYEKQLEEKLTTSGATVYPPVMGKLRIVQGDVLFSRCFKHEYKPIGKTKAYKYVAHEGKVDVQTLRVILRYYVEACNFMAQHSPIYFAAVVRVLQRRIELLSDKFSLQEILHSLPIIWADQEYLKEKTEERETLSQFAKIRSILEYENIK